MKEFKTYDEQIDLLKTRGLKFVDEEFALNKLEEDNYYSIINGYKALFLNKEDVNKFKNNVLFPLTHPTKIGIDLGQYL